MRSRDIKSAPAPRRVTAQMVAEAAGVSRSAVSRAFTPGAYLDAEKRERIQEIAAELGYQPNAMAAGLKGGASHLVAIFVGNMRNPYDSDFVSRLVRALNGMNKWPILIDGSDDNAQSAMEELTRYPLDALILRGGSMWAETAEHCARIGVPMISSGRPIDAPHVDNVCCEHAVGSSMITQLLLDRGRQRFGFVAGPDGFYSSAERRLGVHRALSAAGMTLLSEVQGDYTVEGGYQVAAQMLQQQDLDALICANDAMAIGALAAARESGIDVPQNLSVVGFDDIAMAQWPAVNLTTVCNPIDASVEHIVDLLSLRLASSRRDGETRTLTPYIVERGTH